MAGFQIIAMWVAANKTFRNDTNKVLGVNKEEDINSAQTKCEMTMMAVVNYFLEEKAFELGFHK